MIADSQQEKVSFQRKFKRAYQRILLWAIGRFAPVRAKENQVVSPNNILVFVQEKLGDAILTTPLFKNLKLHFPDVLIHIVIFHKTSDIFDEDPNIFRVHNYKKNKITTIKQLKKLDFDILFNTKDHPSFTFILLSRYLNAKYKVGIDHRFHRNHYHHLFHVDFMTHTIKKNCSLLDNLNISEKIDDLKPYIPAKSISKEVEEFSELMPKNQIIGINLSAGSSEKEWSTDKWKELIKSLDERFIVFGIGDRLADKRHLENVCDQVDESPDTHSINDAAAIVQNLKLLITPSTGLLHVASCFDIGVVGLYRHDPSDHLRFAPYQVPYKKVIAKDHFVSKISIPEVFNATKSLLNEEKHINNIEDFHGKRN